MSSVQPLQSILSSLESGARPKGGVTSDSGEIPSIGGEHVDDDGGFRLSTVRRIPRQFFEAMRAGRIRPFDILVVKDGATTGKTSFVREDFPFRDAAVNEHVFCVRVDSGKASPTYVYHFLRSPRGQKAIQLDFRGATVGGISREFATKVVLPVPSLPEQRRIAEILDRAEALRAKRRGALAQLDTLTQAVFLDLFGDPVSNPKALPKEALGALIKVKSGDFLPASEMAVDGSFPVLGGNGINGYHDRYLFEAPQIVVGRVGVYCGCVHVSPARSWITDNALYVNERSSLLEFDYLAFALKFANLNRQASQSGQPLVSGSRIYPVEILVPPLPLQHEFARRVAAVEKLKAAQRASLAQLNALFASLQHRAFRGELSGCDIEL